MRANPEEIDAAEADYFAKREAYRAARTPENERVMLAAFYRWQHLLGDVES